VPRPSVLIAMAAALVVAVWWFRRRKVVAGIVATGQGSTIGSKPGGVAPQPVATTIQTQPIDVPPLVGLGGTSTVAPAPPAAAPFPILRGLGGYPGGRSKNGVLTPRGWQ
jgi:hypothetical protein